MLRCDKGAVLRATGLAGSRRAFIPCPRAFCAKYREREPGCLTSWCGADGVLVRWGRWPSRRCAVPSGVLQLVWSA